MSDTLSRLSAALSGRYRLEREIGAGGMATVYLAHDLKHNREVAVKVLRPELAAVLGAQRFLQEIQVMANLQHPHILALYDSGEANGQLFYVMPLVKGESLRARITREKTLPITDAMTIARQIAGALDFAHRLGVVHRDIKPENILMHEGEAMLADFGIALAVSEAGGDRLTQTGLSLGTPSYMSPEQATGEREITAKSDIYSLGAITYEMMAGEPPVTGLSARAMVAKLLTAQATLLSAMRDGVPPNVNDAVMRALAKDPSDRFATAKEFAEAMKSVPVAPVAPVSSTAAVPASPSRGGRRLFAAAMVITAIAAVVGAVSTFSKSGPGGSGASSTQSIAVLPFVDRGADSSAYLGDGIAETLTFALGKVPGLKVAAQTSAFTFKGREADLAEIGTKLGVTRVLSGSVQRAGTKIRVTVRLEDVAGQAEVWTDQYDREMSDVFALQDDIARAVVTRLQATASSATIVNAGTQNVAAYEAYIEGRALLARRGEGLVPAVERFERAVALDSNYALAWTGLADGYMLLRFYGAMKDAEAVPKFQRALARALAIDSMLAPARATRAFWLHHYDYDLDGAEREFRRAIELDSTYVPARYWFGVFLAGARFRMAEGMAQAKRAVELDPLSPHAANQLAMTYAAVGDTAAAAAVAEARRAVSLNPNRQNYRTLGRVLLMAGQAREGVAYLDTAVSVSGRANYEIMERAIAAGQTGDQARALMLRAELRAQRAAGRGGAFAVAAAEFWTVGADSAVPWLVRAFAERDPLRAWPGVALPSIVASGRLTRRYVEFWKRMGVPDSIFAKVTIR